MAKKTKPLTTRAKNKKLIKELNEKNKTQWGIDLDDLSHLTLNGKIEIELIPDPKHGQPPHSRGVNGLRFMQGQKELFKLNRHQLINLSDSFRRLICNID